MSGLYFHIPFCRKACTYCDFHFSTSQRTRDDVVSAMHIELDRRAGELQGASIGTLYFGGGTPSLIDPMILGSFIARARTLFPFEHDVEVTLEANPDDVSPERIAQWKDIGITRLSIGVQSFREDRLRFMGRAHDAQQSLRSLELIAAAGFASWTMDLIYGLPQMTESEWDEQLTRAFSFLPPHLSSYCLTVEAKTTLAHRVQAGNVVMPGDEDQAAQFERLMERTEQAGLVHYEISNFGREGHFSRHNTSYWKGVPYLGIGPSAHSFDGSVRRWNVAHNARYATGALGDQRYWQEEHLTPAQRTNEQVMTGLRTMWGVQLDRLPIDVVEHSAAMLRHHVGRGHLLHERGHLVLTRQGRNFADRIASDLFVTDDR